MAHSAIGMAKIRADSPIENHSPGRSQPLSLYFDPSPAPLTSLGVWRFLHSRTPGAARRTPIDTQLRRRCLTIIFYKSRCDFPTPFGTTGHGESFTLEISSSDRRKILAHTGDSKNGKCPLFFRTNVFGSWLVLRPLFFLLLPPLRGATYPRASRCWEARR